MAFANSAISDLVATTIQARNKEFADNLTINSPLYARLAKRGNVRKWNGGNVIVEELMYADSTTDNTGSFSGYDAIDITPNSPLSAAQFDIKQYSGAVSMSGLEMAMNAGEEQMIDLVDSRVTVARQSLVNRLATAVYGDGTGNSGKDLTGLASAVADTPTSGTYGGVNRATWTFWRNKAFSSATDGGAAATSANIQSYMNRLALQLVRNNDSPDLAVADNNYYRLFLESMQSIQRVQSENSELAKLGFTSLKYLGAGNAMDVVLEGGINGAIGANRMYMLNTNFIYLRPHADVNFKVSDDRQSVNQDALVRLILWYGNLTCSGAQFQGVLKA